MQIGEAVAVAVFKPGKDTKCPLEPHSKEKGFTGKKPGVKSVASLRKAMKAGWTTRQWKQEGESFVKKKEQEGPCKEVPVTGDSPITIAGVDYPLSVAAHHIIPGKASLPESSLKKYLWKSEGLIRSDVGYDCDGSENGVWLPTHQTMSRKLGKKQEIVIHDDEAPSAGKGLSWAELSDKAREAEGDQASYTAMFLRRYTQQAMMTVGAQFHDAHSNYNSYVTKALNKVSILLDSKIEMCEKCKEDDLKSPPYMLVYRLNSISARIESRFLKGRPTVHWKTVYTSNFSKLYAVSPVPEDKLR